MKVKLTIDEAFEVFNYAQVVSVAPALRHARDKLLRGANNIQDSLVDREFVRKTERGWKFRKSHKDLEVSFDLSREELLAVYTVFSIRKGKKANGLSKTFLSAERKLRKALLDNEGSSDALVLDMRSLLLGLMPAAT